MSAAASNVIELVTEQAVERAWEALSEHRRPLVDNPRLLLDREFFQKDTVLSDRYRRLYLRWCGR